MFLLLIFIRQQAGQPLPVQRSEGLSVRCYCILGKWDYLFPSYHSQRESDHSWNNFRRTFLESTWWTSFSFGL